MVGDRPGGNILSASVLRRSSCCFRSAISLFKLDRSGCCGRAAADELTTAAAAEGGRGGEVIPRSPRAAAAAGLGREGTLLLEDGVLLPPPFLTAADVGPLFDEGDLALGDRDEVELLLLLLLFVTCTNT